jgi:hypothetical protein
MALLHAEKQGWKGYREDGSGPAPINQDATSELRTLARRIFDEDILSAELLDAGCFDDTDPPTGTEASDNIAGAELATSVRKVLEGKTEDSAEDSE